MYKILKRFPKLDLLNVLCQLLWYSVPKLYYINWISIADFALSGLPSNWHDFWCRHWFYQFQCPNFLQLNSRNHLESNEKLGRLSSRGKFLHECSSLDFNFLIIKHIWTINLWLKAAFLSNYASLIDARGYQITSGHCESQYNRFF